MWWRVLKPCSIWSRKKSYTVCIIGSCVGNSHVTALTAKIIRSTLIKYRSDTFASDWCQIDIDPMVFAIERWCGKRSRAVTSSWPYSLQWRHNGLDGVSNHQPRHCLHSRLFWRRSKKTSKFRVTGLCAVNSLGTGEFPVQMASNAENVSIWWRHNGTVPWWRHGPNCLNYVLFSLLVGPILFIHNFMWSSWSYSRENGLLRSNTSTSSSHHAKMWGVDYAIFGIIRNAMSCRITRLNVTIFWRADFVSYHFKSKSFFFINIYFHQTQSDRADRYHWTLPPPKNIVPYFICFASIIKAKEASFNKTDEIISYNMYTVAMDTTTKPF